MSSRAVFDFRKGLEAIDEQLQAYYWSLCDADRLIIIELAKSIFFKRIYGIGQSSAIELAIKTGQFIYKAKAFSLLEKVPLKKFKKAVSYFEQEGQL